jgi:hypothetical protein
MTVIQQPTVNEVDEDRLDVGGLAAEVLRHGGHVLPVPAVLVGLIVWGEV